jgi:hypothetical protein
LNLNAPLNFGTARLKAYRLPFLVLPFDVLPILILLLDAPPILPFLMLLFMPPMLPLVVVVVVLVFAPPPAVEALEVDVVVLVLVVVVFALPLVLSVAQPLQKAATASRAKSAMVLRIEFSPVPNGLDCYELCDLLAGESQRINSAKDRATRRRPLPGFHAESLTMGHVDYPRPIGLDISSFVRAKTFKDCALSLPLALEHQRESKERTPRLSQTRVGVCQ